MKEKVLLLQHFFLAMDKYICSESLKGRFMLNICRKIIQHDICRYSCICKTVELILCSQLNNQSYLT